MMQVFSFTRHVDGQNLTQTYHRNDMGVKYEVIAASVVNGSFLVEALTPRELVAEVTVIAI